MIHLNLSAGLIFHILLRKQQTLFQINLVMGPSRAVWFWGCFEGMTGNIYMNGKCDDLSDDEGLGERL